MDTDDAAAATARAAVVQAAIDSDPLVSLKDANECTPLHLAIINGAALLGVPAGGSAAAAAAGA